MKFRATLCAAVLLASGASIISEISTAATAAPLKQGAAYPKGTYGALNSLPDWGGVWVLERPKPPAPGDPPRERPALKGEYLKHYEAWQKEVKDNNGLVRKETSNCMPPGMPGMMGTGQYPIEFLFTPGRVTMHHEAWMQWRSIYTDGRGHPDDLEPGIFGHSIGHWEGSVLVVDTVGVKTVTEMGGGVKHSNALHITERFHQDAKDPDLLQLEMTMEDPEALEHPYHVNHTFRRQRDWSLMEFVCAENDRNPVDQSGHTGFEPGAK
jgi:hypothetical protein